MELGEKIDLLMASKEWKAASEVIEAYLSLWKQNLFSYDASKSLEDLGREREKWCLMRRGVEEILKGFQECIEAHRNREEKKEVLKKTKFNNPYRED